MAGRVQRTPDRDGAIQLRMHNVAENVGSRFIVLPPSQLETQLPAVVRSEPTLEAKRLDDAIACMGRFEASLNQALDTRYLATKNPVSRWLFKKPWQAMATLIAVPSVLVAGSIAAFSQAPPVAGPAVGAAVGAFTALFCLLDRDEVNRHRCFTREQLRTNDVSETQAFISGLSTQERALLAPFAKQAIREMVAVGRLSPAANERLLSSFEPEGTELIAEQRSAKVAAFVHRAKTHALVDWQSDLQGVLEQYSLGERREVASLLLARCFSDERCTLNMNASDGDALYHELRRVENARE